jgi:predicted ArsR family transcriptional regulator
MANVGRPKKYFNNTKTGIYFRLPQEYHDILQRIANENLDSVSNSSRKLIIKALNSIKGVK